MGFGIAISGLMTAGVVAQFSPAVADLITALDLVGMVAVFVVPRAFENLVCLVVKAVILKTHEIIRVSDFATDIYLNTPNYRTRHRRHTARAAELVLKHIAAQSTERAKGFMLVGAICYDATAIKLSADLADKSNALLISALNKDVNTFNSMVDALHFYMYQHIVLVNTGGYCGSYIIAPYQECHERLIARTTGKNQVTINAFEMNIFDFRKDGAERGMVSNVNVKAPPAGVEVSKH